MPRILSLLVIIWLCTGCTRFQRDWRQAAHKPAVGIEGRWEGTWQSNSPGHAGKLRCLLTKIDDQKYEAKFHAKYKKVLGFGYTAIFAGTNANNIFAFSGDADLGKLAGGIYRYQGEISLTNFFSTYNSKYDRGTLTLQRLK